MAPTTSTPASATSRRAFQDEHNGVHDEHAERRNDEQNGASTTNRTVSKTQNGEHTSVHDEQNDEHTNVQHRRNGAHDE
jgi:hypothetical protein